MQTAPEAAQDLALALMLAPGVGSATIRRVLAAVEVGGGAEGLLSLGADQLRERYGLPRRAAGALAHGGARLASKIQGCKARMAGKPVRLVTVSSPLYPAGVSEFCKSPPGVLVCYGNLNLLQSKRFCALASRDAGPEALDRLEKCVEEGVLSSLTLVTGANTGPYRRAAVVPLRWGSPRILVLDRGIFRALGDGLDREPFPAARLWRYRFDPDTDLVVSCFRPDDGFIGANNRVRDELVVALSDEVRLVHVARGGNTERLSARARRLGRKVVDAS